jgi:hypothetical protein
MAAGSEGSSISERRILRASSTARPSKFKSATKASSTLAFNSCVSARYSPIWNQKRREMRRGNHCWNGWRGGVEEAGHLGAVKAGRLLEKA